MSEPLLKSLAESADFDSPIRRFDPSRPSQMRPTPRARPHPAPIGQPVVVDG